MVQRSLYPQRLDVSIWCAQAGGAAKDQPRRQHVWRPQQEWHSDSVLFAIARRWGVRGVGQQFPLGNLQRRTTTKTANALSSGQSVGHPPSASSHTHLAVSERPDRGATSMKGRAPHTRREAPETRRRSPGWKAPRPASRQSPSDKSLVAASGRDQRNCETNFTGPAQPPPPARRGDSTAADWDGTTAGAWASSGASHTP